MIGKEIKQEIENQPNTEFIYLKWNKSIKSTKFKEIKILGKDLTKNQICMLVTNKLLGLKITN